MNLLPVTITVTVSIIINTGSSYIKCHLLLKEMYMYYLPLN